eukprot:SAG31_NODE_27301_length_428_cov_0.890578_1_plen_46_part_00
MDVCADAGGSSIRHAVLAVDAVTLHAEEETLAVFKLLLASVFLQL